MDYFFLLSYTVEKHMAKCKKVFCGFVDLKKVLDRFVKKTMEKFVSYEIDELLLRPEQHVWIKQSMYTDWRQHIALV